MVILKKKKEYVKPPDRHIFEKRPKELNSQSIRGYGSAIAPTDYNPPPIRPPLYAIGWGWNSGGRAGNITKDEIHTPRQIQHSITQNYISAAAGEHHSLLVSAEGLIYSFGEGDQYQLGYGNEFTEKFNSKELKKINCQSYPRIVSPSGELKFDRDLQFVEVAAGRKFSVAREISIEEAMKLHRGLNELEAAIKNLKHIFSESDSVNRAWSAVRQERFMIGLKATGLLASWGHGKSGQLGLGEISMSKSYPSIIPKLRSVSISKISAGQEHVLAISSDAFLYSWGCGQCGKLGHGDFENKYFPEIVVFFLNTYVEYCSAGDNHSAVIVTNRKGIPRSDQIRRVSTFGRGAHGRLGNGTNKNASSPLVVQLWPHSLRGAQVHQVACGGAHTVALLSSSKGVKTGLANPWGTRTFVATWGYGSNGQLGTGYTSHSFVPVRARLPKCEIIASVSCGRSWTTAQTIDGKLYSWGKGLRGQLGQGEDVKFSLAPQIVDCFASVIEVSSGLAHNISIGVKKKFFDEKNSLTTTIQNARDGNVFKNIVQKSLREIDCDSEYGFVCSRRNLNTASQKFQLRFQCAECKLSAICYVCAKLCHGGHTLNLVPSIREKNAAVAAAMASRLRTPQTPVSRAHSPPKGAKKKGAAKAGGIDHPRSPTPKLVIPIFSKLNQDPLVEKKKLKRKAPTTETSSTSTESASHHSNSASLAVIPSPFASTCEPCCKCGIYNQYCKVIPVIPEIDEEIEAAIVSRENLAARRIQKMAKVYVARSLQEKKENVIKNLRRQAATKYYFQNIMKPIWQKLNKAWTSFRQSRESRDMALEDALKHSFDYMFYLQCAIGGMNGVMFGLKALLGQSSINLPRVQQGGVVTDQIRPTHTFSWASARDQQLRLQHFLRVPYTEFAVACENFPRFDAHEARYSDPDIAMLVRRFLKDTRRERHRARVLAAEKAAREAKEKRAQAALQALMAQKFAGKEMIAKAQAIMKVAPVAPSQPPPPWVLRAAAQEAKAAARQKEDEDIKAAYEFEDAPYDLYSKDKKPRVWRRNSITDPLGLYGRIQDMHFNIQLQSFAKRRYSLPSRIELLRPLSIPNPSFLPEIVKSLSVQASRKKLIDELVDPTFAGLWLNVSDEKMRARKKRVLGYSWLTPRLPRELLQIITDGARRRTVAEPERLSKQLASLFEIRNGLSTLREEMRTAAVKCPIRRRSFDYGEELDETSGISEMLGYEFDEPFHVETIGKLKRDSSMFKDLLAGKQANGYADDDSDDDNSRFKDVDEHSTSDALVAAKRQPALGKFSAKSGNPGTVKGSLFGGNVEDEEEEEAERPQNTNPLLKRGGAVLSRKTLVPGVIIWQEHFSEDGLTYYYRPATGESIWDYPVAPAGRTDDVQILSQYQDTDGCFYWYNNTTGETSSVV